MQRQSLGERASAAWSVLRGRQVRQETLESLLTAQRGYHSGSTGGVAVTADSALRHSAVWACLRLRANLVSSMPVDAFRRVDGLQVPVATPQVLIEPTPGQPIREWLYGSQFDLDRYGNVFGIIHERTALGLPAVVELVPTGEVAITTNGRVLRTVRVNGEVIPLGMLHHEKQYVPAGFALGLSPIQAAAYSIGGYLAAQQFALQWYELDGAHPSGVLRNSERVVDPKQAAEVKQAFKAATRNRDLFVVGKDWEWTAEAVTAEATGFLEQLRWGTQDIARFFDVPGDMIDAPTPGGSVTYANVTQRMLQLFVTSMGPVVGRREDALSAMLPRPRFAKLNTDSVLRMDPQTRSQMLVAEVAGRVRAPSEVRELHNLPPFTEAQYAEFDRLFGGGAPAEPPPSQEPAQQDTDTVEVPA